MNIHSAKQAMNMTMALLAKEEPTITYLAVHPGMVETEAFARMLKDGKEHMQTAQHSLLMNVAQSKKLLDPKEPGEALAKLVISAPREQSGRFVNWNDPWVKQL